MQGPGPQPSRTPAKPPLPLGRLALGASLLLLAGCAQLPELGPKPRRRARRKALPPGRAFRRPPCAVARRPLVGELRRSAARRPDRRGAGRLAHSGGGRGAARAGPGHDPGGGLGQPAAAERERGDQRRPLQQQPPDPARGDAAGLERPGSRHAGLPLGARFLGEEPRGPRRRRLAARRGTGRTRAGATAARVPASRPATRSWAGSMPAARRLRSRWRSGARPTRCSPSATGMAWRRRAACAPPRRASRRPKGPCCRWTSKSAQRATASPRCWATDPTAASRSPFPAKPVRAFRLPAPTSPAPARAPPRHRRRTAAGRGGGRARRVGHAGLLSQRVPVGLSRRAVARPRPPVASRRHRRLVSGPVMSLPILRAGACTASGAGGSHGRHRCGRVGRPDPRPRAARTWRTPAPASRALANGSSRRGKPSTPGAGPSPRHRTLPGRSRHLPRGAHGRRRDSRPLARHRPALAPFASTSPSSAPSAAATAAPAQTAVRKPPSPHPSTIPCTQRNQRHLGPPPTPAPPPPQPCSPPQPRACSRLGARRRCRRRRLQHVLVAARLPLRQHRQRLRRRRGGAGHAADRRPVAEVQVKDTQAVKRGDVLVVLDPPDAQLAVAQAEADLAGRAARAQLPGQRRQPVGRRSRRARPTSAARGAARRRPRPTVESARIDLQRRQALAARARSPATS